MKKRSLKNFFGLFVALVVIVSLWSCQSKEEGVEFTLPDTVTSEKTEEGSILETLPDVVAVINGKNISKKQLETMYTSMLNMAVMTGGTQIDKQGILNTALNEIINGEILRQESRRQNLAPTREEIDREMKRLMSHFQNEETFSKTMSNEGLSMDDVKKELTARISIRTLLQKEVNDNVTLNEREIEDFYNNNLEKFRSNEAVRASHIFVKAGKDTSEADRATARKKIDNALEELKDVEDFATLAKKYSEDTTAEMGGDLGFFERAQMVKPFSDAAFSMKQGEVSGVVETEYGYHIIKVTEIREAGITPLRNAAKTIEAYLKNQKTQAMTESYLKSLRSKVKIERRI